MALKFTPEHAWLLRTDSSNSATVGITVHAQDTLGDVVFVELPDVGKVLKTGDAMAVVESVKAASDVYAPVSGEVVAVNAALPSSPETVNAVPEGEGWFAKVRLANPAEVEALMDRPAYETFLATL